MRIPPLDLRPAVFDFGIAEEKADWLIYQRAKSAFAPDARPLWAALAELDVSLLTLAEMRLWIDEFDQPPDEYDEPPNEEMRDNGEWQVENKIARAANLMFLVHRAMVRLHEFKTHMEAERANLRQELARIRSGSPSRVRP